MRVFYDTEFTTLMTKAELISVGLVTEDGQEFYAEVCFDKSQCSDFVKEVVIPLLDGNIEQRMKPTELATKLSDWLNELGEDIVLVSDSTWDYYVLNPVFAPHGGLQALSPSTKLQIAPFIEDTHARIRFGEAYSEYFLRNPGKQHHALHDAKALRSAVLASEGHYY
jgi:hypothetical protein